MLLTPLVRRLGHRRWFARLFRTLVPADRLLGRATRGRFVALNLDGLPSLVITTTGRRTGEPGTTRCCTPRTGTGTW